MRVVAAMSGGVDSSVAAARMVDAGHEVVGVHLALQERADKVTGRAHGCCTLDDAADARRVADRLGIPFYVWDFADRFREEVMTDFLQQYAQGRTPNPCIRCNERVKFAALLDKALALGFDAVATGHYAQVRQGSDGVRELHRGVDPGKDQSYVLAVLDAEQLAATELPIGGSTKAQIRQEAQARGLAVAAKPDSHDICFIPDGDTRAFLARHLPDTAAVIVDQDGTELGRHDSALGLTVGQRRGLALSRPAPDGRPRFVLSVRPREGTVVVGPRQALSVGGLTASGVRWCGRVDGADRPVQVQLRAHADPVPGRVRVEDSGRAEVELDEPVQGVAPGQTVAWYDGTRVVGSATIEATRPASAPAG